LTWCAKLQKRVIALLWRKLLADWPHYANAAALYRQIGPPKMLAGTLRHEADLWMQANRREEAEPLYLEAEKIYRQPGEESALDLAHTLRALALIREANKKLPS
jgi:hypothetical protein